MVLADVHLIVIFDIHSNFEGVVPLTKFDVRFEAAADVYFYENHVGGFVLRNVGQNVRHSVVLTFPWNNKDQFSCTPNRKCRWFSHSK